MEAPMKMQTGMALALAALASPPMVLVAQDATRPAVAEVSTIQEMRDQAHALRPLAPSALGMQFLAAVDALRSITPRTLLFNKQAKQWHTADEAATLSDEERSACREVTVDDKLYYFTKYGTPLADVRPLEILGQAGIENFKDKKILDFGYGTIGHLRMMASRGADVFGLDVDPFLTALYREPTDIGVIDGPDNT